MHPGVVSDTVGVDFTIGEGKWSDEDFIDVAVEGSVGSVLADNQWDLARVQVSTDVFRGSDSTVDPEVGSVSVVGEADVVPAVGWGLEVASQDTVSYWVPHVQGTRDGVGASDGDDDSFSTVGKDSAVGAGTIAVEERTPGSRGTGIPALEAGDFQVTTVDVEGTTAVGAESGIDLSTIVHEGGELED